MTRTTIHDPRDGGPEPAADRTVPSRESASTPRVYAEVINPQTGRTRQRLGPYATVAQTRTACGHVVGQALVWARQEGFWVAEWDGQQYRIQAELPTDA